MSIIRDASRHDKVRAERCPGAGAVSASTGLGPEGYVPSPGLAVLDPPDSPRDAQTNSGGAGGGAPASALLVGTRHNSAKLHTARHEHRAPKREDFCPSPHVLKGTCLAHSVVRWKLTSCKRRTCPVCGRASRYLIAERVALGVRQFWPAAWLVLTFRTDVDKKTAVRRLSGFVRWLRRRTGTTLEYAATYELTRRGRLHVNLIIGPWSYVPLSELVECWGARVSVEWVRDDGTLGAEVAKAYSPEGLGGYLLKLEQSVPEDRRVSFSKHWPKLPKPERRRKGWIDWQVVAISEEVVFKLQKQKGEWVDSGPNEWKAAVDVDPECHCFEYEDG